MLRGAVWKCGGCLVNMDLGLVLLLTLVSLALLRCTSRLLES